MQHQLLNGAYVHVLLSPIVSQSGLKEKEEKEGRRYKAQR